MALPLALSVAVWATGCGVEPAIPDSPDDGTVSFAGRIQPIFTANCAVCHRPGGIAHLRGIELQLLEGESHNRLVNQPSVQEPALTIVVPGDSASSLLFLKISSDSPPVGDRMPLGGPPLSQSRIDLIRDWIDQGARNN
jgi:hypothetical protein